MGRSARHGRQEVLDTIDALTLECRRRFSDVATTETRLLATQMPGIRRMELVYDLLCPFMPNGEGEVHALELGVGHGELVLPMARLFPETRWTAIEHPRRSYLGEATYRTALETARCRLVGASLTSPPLPFRDQEFDLITFSEVLEHLPGPSILPLLAEAHRVLRPGGRMIVTSPNLVGLPYRLMLLCGRSPFDLPIETSFAPDTYGHIHLYTPEEVGELGKAAGLVTETVRFKTWMLGHYCFDSLLMRTAERLLWLADRTLARLRPRLRDSWAVVLQCPA